MDAYRKVGRDLGVMSSNDGLTAPGSSTYASDTLHVGDGTWDSSRDTFLLPNLMGLNFDTMRYNGKLIGQIERENSSD